MLTVAAVCGVVGHGSARPVQAVLFDMDGVMADVSKSYRAAIIEVRLRS